MPRTLIVDDSGAARLFVSRAMSNLGYEVSTARNGREALDRLFDGIPDLTVMLVDWNMPEVDGIEFVKRARGIPEYRSVPVMMVTTETEMDRVIEALEAGANEYIMKPFTEDDLASKLRLMNVPC
jgi:two-component system chemotaxis response regulator CheY